jgi:hypothetical protein
METGSLSSRATVGTIDSFSRVVAMLIPVDLSN